MCLILPYFVFRLKKFLYRLWVISSINVSYIIAFISTMFNQLGCLFSYVGHTAIKEEKRGKPNTFSNWHNIHQLTFNAQSAPEPYSKKSNKQ